MAGKQPFKTRRKRVAFTPDEFGGFVDGGLAILDADGNRIHVTPTRVASALRYFLARVELHSPEGLPVRLALTAALVGEGVTFVTRSLAAVVAYVAVGAARVVLWGGRQRRPTLAGVAFHPSKLAGSFVRRGGCEVFTRPV